MASTIKFSVTNTNFPFNGIIYSITMFMFSDAKSNNKIVNKILMLQSHGYNEKKKKHLKQKFVDEHIGPSKK